MRGTRGVGLAAGACLLVLVLTVVGTLSAPTVGVRPAPPAGAVGATLLVPSATAAGSPTVIGSDFWGANLRPYYSLGSTASSTYRSTGLSVVRWPGGAVADRLNLTANRIYNDNGTFSTPPVNESAFVGWCRAVGCAAVIGLPGEIDSPSTAAYYVAYTEQTLHFTPLYWEIGNEPALWTHFGYPWTGWNESQDRNATPASYAQVVHAYIQAIRAVDPTAQFLGLPGVGQGADGEAGWIRATVAVNGANLSGVAIHVYPAGGNVTGTASLGGFFATLGGSSSLPSRITADRAAITGACATCGPIPILVTELGSGTQGGAYNSYMTGFPDVPYLATEVIQALAVNVSQIDLFAFQATYGGSLLEANGTPSRTAVLYEDLLAHLGPTVATTFQGPTNSGVVGVTTQAANGSGDVVLLANTNLSNAFTVAPTGLPPSTPAAGTLLTWNGTTATPVATAFAANGTPTVSLPAESVALLILNGSGSSVGPGTANSSSPPAELGGAVHVPSWGATFGLSAAGLGIAAAPPLLGRRPRA